jgi:hypothetical protein
VKIRLRIPLDNPPDGDLTHRHPNRPPSQATPRRCQLKTVCVPFMGTDGDSYRMREARANGGTTLNKT